MSQEPVLFARSITDNISYGLPTVPFETVVEAAQKANAHGFIMELQDGYNTGTEHHLHCARRSILRDSTLWVMRCPLPATLYYFRGNPHNINLTVFKYLSIYLFGCIESWLQYLGAFAVALRLSYPLHCKADSEPLEHWGSP